MNEAPRAPAVGTSLATPQKKNSLPPPRSHRLYMVLSHDPLIILTYERLETIEQMCERIGPKPAFFLVVFKWTMEDPRRIAELARRHRELVARHAQKHIVFLGNTEPEVDLLREKGLKTVFCNQNALLDEQVYRPVPRPNEIVKKRFDAIYNGQIEPFKRHHLAAAIESLALITYTLYYKSLKPRRAYFDEVRQLLPNASMLNWPGHPRFADCDFDPELPRIPNHRISAHLATAKVGVILSAEEGACWAACEYLLSGLPVVSTRSRGGRDVIFEEPYALIVDDDPEAVADGVRELIFRDLDPESIRSRTLEILDDHRQRFIAQVNDFYRQSGQSRDFADEWPQVFINRMMRVRQWPGDFELDLEEAAS